ncbi:hypothetical protein P296_16475 [Salmonella enterica subsp. arizonae serovar 18:z4,z23:- str. CVM N26624]|nr:hypothetical protein N898_21980 [Salmonella enterica subsp. arizonae serovar 62:z36:- str. RKS2983]OLV98968.1 hypothetical protein P296_16475 [Salmonella enterica subsp. arizonae serovar 18:z4,z23:- str. CVM N26624]OLW01671.1 hypothetical protein P297_10960 [Salmonella enterica subsp. arizonae serovar 18:z4,z23:- str. CVM N26625]OLW03655.1 hypothetical protein P298_08825 [Salmonella enterica subsp. arizonae serovar 18:z4,z23:- str. CVM N26626]OLW05218.1 hypothetical protein P293_03855 [Salmo
MERLQDEAKWKAQDALKDTSRTENESRLGWSAGLDDQGRFGMKLSHRGDVRRMQTFRMSRPQGHRKSCHG